jgi:prepilin-type N-terminal cleavage/methylation domain-containing protein
MKKLNKKLKGMTLVEIIVSLAIFAMFAMILVMLGNSVEKNSREANKLNKKVAVNGPVAEMQNSKKTYIANDKHVIRVADKKTLQTNTSGEWASNYVKIEGTLCYVNEDLTNAVTTNTEGLSGIVVDPTDPTASNGNYDFNFIIVTKPTGFATAAASDTTSTTTPD